ncbi:MAG: WecB/TagA/CpsF family glycosyltransferase [Beijerinckiaceae bacterium]
MTLGPIDRPPFPTRNVLGVAISVARQRAAIEFLLGRLAARRPITVAFANAHLLMSLPSSPAGTGLLDGFLILNDGIGVDLASLLLYRDWFPDNLNGTDFTPALLAAAPPGTKVFLYGAKPEIVAKAAGRIAERTGCLVCGTQSGFSCLAEDEIAKSVKAASPDIVLVALGNPLQEEWIAGYAAFIGAPLMLGVGAFFDFFSQSVPRAPLPVRKLRLEWLYRWAQEPGRLRRRYTIEMARFSARVLRQARARRV